jgi:hypothetical protein
MSDPPRLSQAGAANKETANSAGRQESQVESGELFLGSEGGWKVEAEGVIKDVEKFVKNISVAEKIQVGSKFCSVCV